MGPEYQDIPDPEESIGVNIFAIQAGFEIQTSELVNAAEACIAEPTDPEKVTELKRSSQVLKKGFGELIKCVLEQDLTIQEKLDMTILIQEEEAEKRVRKFNELLGKELLSPGLFISYNGSPEETEKEITNVAIFNSATSIFQSTLSTELDEFMDHAASDGSEVTFLSDIKEVTLEKSIEVATIVGGVVLGILIAKRINKN